MGGVRCVQEIGYGGPCQPGWQVRSAGGYEVPLPIMCKCAGGKAASVPAGRLSSHPDIQPDQVDAAWQVCRIGVEEGKRETETERESISVGA